MKPLDIRERIVFLLGLLTLAFILAVAYLNDLEGDRARGLLRETRQEKEKHFDRLVELKGAALATFAQDYTFWDDMVRFVQTGDRQWATENIDTALSTYGLDAIWVYTADGVFVYSVEARDDARLRDAPIATKALAPTFGSKRFVHFFASTPRGIVEIRGATIHPSADSKRLTPPRGYLFAGRFWNARFVGELSGLTGTSIRLLPVSSGQLGPVRTEAAAIAFARVLPGWDGAPVARLEVRGEAPAVAGLTQSANEIRLLAVGFAVAVLLLLSLGLWRWVTAPLTLLSASLSTGTPRPIATMLADRTEFGRLATLIHRFFEQKASLESEVRERAAAEAQIRRLNVELEERVASRTARLEAARAAQAELLAREQVARADAEAAHRREEQANRAKSEFLSRVSHELRTPLNAILGFGQLLEMEPLEVSQQESVAHILRAGRHLLELIDEVLDISRIEAGRLRLALGPLPLRDVVQECLDLIRPATQGTGIEVSALLEGSTEWHVVADRQRLKQVILNLLSNGVKYNREGGTLTISAEQASPTRLRVHVADTGVGIARERLERLFTPFERLGIEKAGIEGVGLGLTVSKGLIDAMGGTIGVESVPGVGTDFWFELPIAPQPVADEASARTTAGS